jgi:sterol desaturase/sphingolipid hydroxylase (fatty acid hydroxylase superfamily)
MDVFNLLLQAVATPFRNLVNPYYWMNVFFLLSTFAVVAGFFILSQRGRRRQLRRLLRYTFPRKLLHPSALLDYRYYFVHGALRALFYAWVVVSAEVWGNLAIVGLTAAFGPGHEDQTSGWVVTAFATVFFVVAYDLAYWYAHWLTHRIDFLWQFHKVHHSAEVLNPFTAMRAHPVDDLLTFNMTSITTGTCLGTFIYFFGEGAHQFTLMQMNALMLVYHLTFFHLRHSHVWLPLNGRLGYILQSPAHHQLHHSTDPAHVGKNLGFCLSIWDWLFGTLYIPKAQGRLTFGIGAETKDYSSIGRLYWLPFVNVARLWREQRSPAVEARREARVGEAVHS